MAFSKVLVASLVISLLVLHLVEAEGMMDSDPNNKPVPQKLDCKAACSVRCSLSKRPNVCERACGTCCARCYCVPPGTSGNRDVCPCYATMTTRGGLPKCP